MNIFRNLSKALISFFVLVSIIVTSTSVFAAEIVGRLSVHWSPKHHSAKHAIISAAKTEVDVTIIDTKTKKIINALDKFLNIFIIF